MVERRKTPRLKEENDVTITVFSEENDLPKEKLINNFTKDISEGGTRIHTNILLPVDSLIELEFTSRGIQQQINSMGKVKWVRVIIEDESYEAGIEYCGSPSDAIKKLGDYISWKLKAKSGLFSKKLSPIEWDDITIAEVEKPPATDSGDISVAIAQEQPSVDLGDININQAQEPSVPDSLSISTVQTKETPPKKSNKWIRISIISLCTIILTVTLLKMLISIPEVDRFLVSNNTNEVVYILYIVALVLGVYGLFNLKNFAMASKDDLAKWGILWAGTMFISVGIIIVGLLNFPQSIISPYIDKIVTKNDSIAHSPVLNMAASASKTSGIVAPAPNALNIPDTTSSVSRTSATATPSSDVTTAATSTSKGPATAAPVTKATLPAGSASPAMPVSETKQKIKVIGNSDTKRYHLPGMKYYNAVKAYHRVEFDSEDDAIKAGYHKAPQ